MKPIRILALAAILTLGVLTISGCTGDTETEASPARLACIEMMQWVPVYYEDFEFWDVGKLRGDADLAEMYSIWYERKVEFLEENYGIPSAGIDYFGEGEGMLDFIKMDYDTGTLRDRIAADFYRDTETTDIEVWKSPQNMSGGLALVEGLLVRGANNDNIDDYLSVAAGEELSMYDKNAAGLLERLPEGIMTRITRSPYPEGLIISGMSFYKETNNDLRWTNVYRFESAEAARSGEVDEYFRMIEEDFTKAQDEMAKRGEPPPFNDFRLERDGEYATWSLSIVTKYMTAMLFYG